MRMAAIGYSSTLKGRGHNSYALGAVVNVYTPQGSMNLENYPVHGFQSSMHVPLHTGLPSAQIDSVVIRWPDGKTETLMNVKANTINNISYQTGQKDPASAENIKSIFSRISSFIAIYACFTRNK